MKEYFRCAKVEESRTRMNVEETSKTETQISKDERTRKWEKVCKRKKNQNGHARDGMWSETDDCKLKRKKEKAKTMRLRD